MIWIRSFTLFGEIAIGLVQKLDGKPSEYMRAFVVIYIPECHALSSRAMNDRLLDHGFPDIKCTAVISRDSLISYLPARVCDLATRLANCTSRLVRTILLKAGDSSHSGIASA